MLHVKVWTFNFLMSKSEKRVFKAFFFICFLLRTVQSWPSGTKWVASQEGWDPQLSNHEILLSTYLHKIFSPEFLLKFGVFLGFNHYFQQNLILVADICHTWMESCVCQRNFATNMSGFSLIRRVWGVLLTIRKNLGPQADTAKAIL